MKIIASVAVLTLLPLGLRADEPAKTFTIPFDLIKTQHMVVSVKINGKGPYKLIFDTGAPDSIVSNKIVKETGLKPAKNAGPAGLPIFGARGQYTLDSLEVGDLKAENLSTMVIDHPTVEAISSVVGPIEGILGFTFFGRYATTIDYQKKQMTLVPTTYQPSDLMGTLMKRLTAPKSVREKAPVLAPGGVLGIGIKKDAKDDEAGVTVTEVLPESAAASAGFKTGDRLLTLDRRWTDSIDDVYLAASHLRPGRAVMAVVSRDGKQVELKLTVRAGL